MPKPSAISAVPTSSKLEEQFYPTSDDIVERSMQLPRGLSGHHCASSLRNGPEERRDLLC